MDVAYRVRVGERNEELRYSLRSLSHVPHGRVFVIGYKPWWLDGVEHIRMAQGQGKWHNSVRLLDALARELAGEITELMLIDDDMYAMEPVVGPPEWHGGPLAARERTAAGAYRRSIQHTLRWLANHGQERPLNYELHVPMRIDLAKLAEVMAAVAGTLPMQIRSIYGNLTGAGGTEHADVKVGSARRPIPAGPWMSSDDGQMRRLGPTLERLFPEPSAYEREAVAA